MSWDNTTQWMDRETVRAMMCATAAAGIGYFLGCPRRSAELAAISALGAALLREVGQVDKHLKKRSLAEKRLLETLIAVPLTCFAAHKMGFRIPKEGYAAVGAGVAIGLVLWGEPGAVKNQKIPVAGYAAIGAAIGMVYPKWWSPVEGAVLMGMVAAHPLAVNRLNEQLSINKDEYKNLAYTATLFATSWLAGKLGFRVSWEQFASAVVATSAVPAALALFESRKTR